MVGVEKQPPGRAGSTREEGRIGRNRNTRVSKPFLTPLGEKKPACSPSSHLPPALGRSPEGKVGAPGKAKWLAGTGGRRREEAERSAEGSLRTSPERERTEEEAGTVGAEGGKGGG
jgi:hypothetical protein